MATHSKVIDRWYEGRPSKGFNMRTDGKNLYSYDLLIGITDEQRQVKIVFDYRGEHRMSLCTTKHIGKATRYGQGRTYELLPPPQEPMWAGSRRP